MKKIILMSLLLLCSVVIAAEKAKNIIIISSAQNMAAGESAWIPESVRDRLESNLQSYTDYSIVSSRDDSIRSLQRKFESAAFSEKDAIELGKRSSASHAIFLKTTKTDSSYIVSLEFTNLTTGEMIAKCVSSARKTTNELFAEAGCAIDVLTLDFCGKNGISLTNAQKTILRQGNLEITDAEQLELYNQELQAYNKKIASLNKEIAELSSSTDDDAKARKIQKEGELALAKEKQKASEAIRARLSAIEKAKKEEEAANANRTEKQKQRILEASKSVNEKVDELRKIKFDGQSAFGKIQIIEAKKSTVINLLEACKSEKKSIRSKYTKEYNEKCESIKNAPWRTGEKDEYDKPVPEYIERREKKAKALNEECRVVIENAENQIDKATYESCMDIYMEIYRDFDEIEDRVFYANTVNKNLHATIGGYSGDRESWSLTYTVVCDGIEIFASKGEIKLKDLDNRGITDMYDKVDLYDSLFRCGDPILTFGLSYKVKRNEKRVSSYDFEFSDLRIYDTSKVSLNEDGSLDGKFKIYSNGKTIFRDMKPEYDIGLSENSKKNNYFVKMYGDIFEKEITSKIENNEISEALIFYDKGDFWLSRTEVTQGLWDTVMTENNNSIKNNMYPVDKVSFIDAIVFCNKLSIKNGLDPCYSAGNEKNPAKWKLPDSKGIEMWLKRLAYDSSANGYRLPTEEEWRYADSGDHKHIFDKYNGRYSVMRNIPDENGLYGMFGSVSEWCWTTSAEKFKVCGSNYEDKELQINTPLERLSMMGLRIARNATASTESNKDILIEKKCEKSLMAALFYKCIIDDDGNRKIVAKEWIMKRLLQGMRKIPERRIKMLETEITQNLYEVIMGENPSEHKSPNNPVEMVSWYDAIYFCNKLSKELGFTPAYSVNGNADPDRWDYVPHKGNRLDGVTQDSNANGFRLPTGKEWEYAARGGKNYAYSGSDKLDEVGWFYGNSDSMTHPVAKKKANGYGLYDMSGNVREWIWDSGELYSGFRYYCGGCFNNIVCEVSSRSYYDARVQNSTLGFRIVCSASE